MIGGPIHAQRAARKLTNAFRPDWYTNGWTEWGTVENIPGSSGVTGTVDVYLNGTQGQNDQSFLTRSVRCIASYPNPQVGDVVLVLHSGGGQQSDRIVLGPVLLGGGVAQDWPASGNQPQITAAPSWGNYGPTLGIVGPPSGLVYVRFSAHVSIESGAAAGQVNGAAWSVGASSALGSALLVQSAVNASTVEGRYTYDGIVSVTAGASYTLQPALQAVNNLAYLSYGGSYGPIFLEVRQV